MAWIRRYKQKKLISKSSVDSNSMFSSYTWLYMFHCSHRLLCWIKSCVRDFLWKFLSFHTKMVLPNSFEEVCFSGESYENMQTKSKFKNFESALYSTSGTMPLSLIMDISRPLTAKLRWCLFSSVPHVSDRLELHNNNWASGILHPGSSESDVYSDVIQEAQSNDLLHAARLSMRLDMSLRDNNARGTKYAVYYVSIVTHTVFENKKMAALTLCWNKKGPVASLASLFPDISCASGPILCLFVLMNRFL